MKNSGYKYEIGEVINGYKILHRIDYKDTYGYQCECIHCKRQFNKTQSEIARIKCNCEQYKFKNRYPELIPLLVNDKDAETYVFNVRHIYEFKCPNCGSVKAYPISSLLYKKFSCDYCSDKVSYSEKLIISILSQININFKRQLSKKTLSWCKNYFYNFYIPDKSCIIETHGKQHYKECSLTQRTLEEEQENDKSKEQLAKENGIKHYIILDCRESNIEWIKKSVLESELPTLFNFTENDIDWIKCELDACTSLMIKACNMYNDGNNIKLIAKNLDLSTTTINHYLSIGNKLKICLYSIYDNKQYAHILHKIKPFICVNTNDLFFDITDCVNQSKLLFNVKLNKVSIGKVLNGKQEHTKNLYFKYINKEEYLKQYMDYVLNSLEERRMCKQ